MSYAKMGYDYFLERSKVVDHDSGLPLNYQIVEGLKNRIKKRLIKPGEFLPSVRTMAIINKINPSTVARAYKTLVKSKVIRSEPRCGYRVN